MKRLATLCVLVLAMAMVEARAAVVFNDGEFTAWSFGSHTGAALATREAAGGNPGARLAITPSANVLSYGWGLKTDYSTTLALAGTSFTLTIDVLAGSGVAGEGQALQLVVEQAGSLYAHPIGTTGVRTTFSPPLVVNGTFSAASFTKVSGAGPATPDFAGGVATRFGIAAGTSLAPQNTQYYDNVQLNLGAVAGTDPCAGFSDVASDASFCQATIWLKNRGITTGCTATQYCPQQTITRAQMALFMNRLGRALAPVTLHTQKLLQNLVLPNENAPPGLLVCATDDFPTGDYARTTEFVGAYHAYPNLTPVVSQGYWRYSTDSGATWSYVGNWQVDQFPAPAVANPGGVASVSVLAPPMNLLPHTTYRFGLFVNGGNNDSIAVNLLMCQVQVTILTPP